VTKFLYFFHFADEKFIKLNWTTGEGMENPPELHAPPILFDQLWLQVSVMLMELITVMVQIAISVRSPQKGEMMGQWVRTLCR
jgi:hypothetical protein